MQVRSIWLAVLVCSGLLLAAAASAADYSWVAQRVLEGGTFRNCAGPNYFDFKIEITGKTVAITEISPQSRGTVKLDLNALKPDGSGKIIFKGRLGFNWFYAFEPGVGP